MPRFYQSPRWKHILTDRDTLQLADLSKLVSNRTARFELGLPATLSGTVPSDDPRVNLIHDDNFAVAEFDPFWFSNMIFNPSLTANFPRLEEGMRLMYSFRREGITSTFDDPWVVRHAGPVLEVTDEADPSRRMTSFTCFDAWQLLYHRPCLVTTYGGGVVVSAALPDANGVNYQRDPPSGAQTGPTGDQIALDLLAGTIVANGSVGIDAGTAWGGTAFYAGTLETTAVLRADAVASNNASSYTNVAVNFPPGTMVGEAWEQLVSTGTMDIVLTPIWDPVNRPGYTHELSIYECAGGDPAFTTITEFPQFNWDRSGRDIIRIERLTDGRGRANQLQFYGGQVGQGGKAEVQLQSNAPSTTRYGEYWHLGQIVNQTTEDKLAKTAQNEAWRRRVAERSWRIFPAPEFSPRPFQDFMPGTWMGFYHSDKLRNEQWWIPRTLNSQNIFPRIIGFTLDIDDNSLETVTDLDISLDVISASNVN